MLRIEFKEATKTDFSSALGKYASKAVSKDSLPDIKSTLDVVNERRADALNHKGQDQLLDYFTYLESLCSHFPVTEEKNLAGLQVCWYDCWKKNWIKTYNLQYERAAIMFNVAVSYAKIGYDTVGNSYDTESLITAAKNFKIAASYFKFIRENMIAGIQLNTTVDLTDDGLLMLEKTMQGLSQFYMTEKSVLTNTKPALLSRLYAGTADIFDEALNSYRRINSKSIPSSVKNQLDTEIYWCNYKAARAQADDFLASARRHERGAGQAVAFLKASVESLKAGLPCARACGGARPQQMADLLTECDGLLKEAYQLNTVGYENIEIEKAPEPYRLDKYEVITLPVAKQLFDSMITKEVETLLESYKRDIVDPCMSQWTQEIAQVNDSLSQQLAQSGVEGLLQSSQDGGIPLELWNKFAAIKDKGGVDNLRVRIEGLVSLRQASVEELAQVKDILAKDAQNDSRLASQYGGKYTPVSLSGMDPRINSELESVSKKLDEGQGGINIIQEKYNGINQNAAIYAASKDELDKRVPQTGSSDNSNEKQKVEDLYNTINTLKEKRNGLFEQLKAATNNNLKVTNELMKDVSRVDTEGIFSRGKTSLESYMTQIRNTFEPQSTYLIQLGSAVENWQASRNDIRGLEARTTQLNVLNDCIRDFNILDTYINQGMEFHNGMKRRLDDLIKNLNSLMLHKQQQAPAPAPAPAPMSSPSLPPKPSTTIPSLPSLPSYGQQQQYQQYPTYNQQPQQQQYQQYPSSTSSLPTYNQQPQQYGQQPQQYGQQQQPQQYGYSSTMASPPPAPYYQQQQQYPPPQNVYQTYQPTYMPQSTMNVGYAPAPSQWSCPTCTFLNKMTSPRCEMCQASKPL